MACVSTMTACGPSMVPSPRPALPADLTRRCPDLTPLEDGTKAAVLRKLAEVGALYYDCQATHDGLVEAVQ